MIVRVTKKHIEQGARTSESSCPVALALKAKGFVQPRVNMLLRSSNGLVMLTPRRVGKFINRFDAGKPVKPFSFTIKVPK